MHRQPLLQLLASHSPADEHERGMLWRMQAFVAGNARCFERSLEEGHVTGSAWIVDPECGHVLLTHHRKLERWLQLGGHADGDADVLAVALREAREESGLADIVTVSNTIFDVDIHEIPRRGAQPAHLHYDVRFLMEADRSVPLVISSESKDLRWVALSKVSRVTSEESVLRMVRKSLRLSGRV